MATPHNQCITPVSNTSGCLTEIAAIGAADAMLTCSAESTLFYQSYKRITNFSAGEASLLIQNSPTSAGWVAASNARCEVQRLGDLLGPVYLEACLHGLTQPLIPESTASVASPDIIPNVKLWTPAVGFALASRTRCVIGGQKIEEISSEYQMALDEIARQEGNRAGKLVGDYGRYLRGCAASSNLAYSADISDEQALQDGLDFSSRDQVLFVPLQMFWTMHPGNYLNVVGLQYHNIDLEFEFRSAQQLEMDLTVDRTTGVLTRNSITAGTGEVEGMQVMAVYIQLDTPERKARAQAAQTVRIVYCQEQIISDSSARREFSNYFNHPVEQLIWAFRQDDRIRYDGNSEYFNFGAYAASVNLLNQSATNVLVSTQEVVPEAYQFGLTLNSHSRFSGPAEYFLYAQPYAHDARQPSRIIYSYSFAQYPDDTSMHSGSLNFSRIDHVRFTALLKPVATVSGQFPNSIGVLAPAGHAGIIGSAFTAFQGGSQAGTYFIWGRTINFYKVAAGMLGLLFAN